ncbi:Sulfatase modifying factor 1 precursor (C-alpha-formyglycine- generating enzyme 1) [Serinicoccus hydrothermalis]|uniref:Sulfatase modifying factor 1 (C-alpha-formyglycine- generating enzyme 1) n=1 Tax=Serinicoccus hydrothermalis TaxID=1758689 RepID=A0A1B1NDL6_9MICO|nr:formylglycine-generating enzyme family protein [Serinicoccus hydrothermalis]ANS79445.1 Sulfatase modifying factor 1 precursor (C-alpha-formyglycine- generating enzyme 1) [Serinicoccus hydrothermalis]
MDAAAADPGRPCCAPSSARPALDRERSAPTGPPPADGLLDLVRLDGGTFRMGSDGPDVNPGDGEGPVREVRVGPFSIGATAVTNAQFATFVEATGYRTGAERFGWSFVFAGFLPGRLRGGERVPGAPWWCRVDGALWSAPEGPGSDVSDRPDHPVVHVDHDDARAFCAWAGGRLPTEAEWEFAARGGLEGARYAWGDELLVDGEHRCNIWQGTFPVRNTREDGWAGTSPVRTFPPNGYALFDVAGNTWEWCSDWWGTGHTGAATADPQGPAGGSARVMRGGSYLCHDSYCNRYRVAARTSNDPDSASGNLGFRCVVPAG